MDEIYTAFSPIKQKDTVINHISYIKGGFYFVVLINAFGYNMFHVIVYYFGADATKIFVSISV